MSEPKSPRASVAERLRSARELAGLTQSQVAKMLGLHRPSVSEMEAGRRRVSAEELIKLAEIYGTSVDWLTSQRSGGKTDVDDKFLIAARQLSRMKEDDFEKLIYLVRLLKDSK